MRDAGFVRLEELFHSALALPVEERAAFLREHCGHDGTLRQEVEELLWAESGPLDVPALEQMEGEDAQGRMAGQWRIGRRIGEGGLGVVYEAFDGERRAAIKFLRPGLDAGSFRQRFVKERRILGGLEHRNIAQLLDGGVDEAGRAYLVMEHVDGKPLDAYLAETNLGRTARVALLTQVCQAVEYLHTSLVAHGDLKPSNILVSSDGVVKLLDFGAARLLHSDARTLTRAFMTPHYASPEQRLGEGPSVGSDIYALGVILGDAFPGGDADLAAIRDHCCRTAVEERYRSVLELEQDLRQYGSRKPVKAGRRDRVYRKLAGVGIVAALLAAAMGGYFLWREGGHTPTVVRTAMNNSAIKERESSGKTGVEVELAQATQSRREGEDSTELASRAMELHAEYKKLFGRPLPPQNAYYRLLLESGPPMAKKGRLEAGRAMLQEVLAAARVAKSREYTARALIELAALEQEPRRTQYCKEAAGAFPAAARLQEVCPGAVKPTDPTAEIRPDPDRVPNARRLAGKHQQLAKQLYDQGRNEEARVELEAANVYLTELVKRKPENRAVRAQAKRARRALAELSR